MEPLEKLREKRKLCSKNIVLIGFMGTGKSTIADYLHTLFDMDVVEMDQLIAEREGMSIPEAVNFANTASSVAVTRKGAQCSIPKRSEVEDLIREKDIIKGK